MHRCTNNLVAAPVAVPRLHPPRYLDHASATSTGGKKERGNRKKKEEKYGRGRLMLSNFGRNRALDTYRGEHYGDARGRALEAASGWQLPYSLPSSGGVYTCWRNKKFCEGSTAPPVPPVSSTPHVRKHVDRRACACRFSGTASRLHAEERGVPELVERRPDDDGRDGEGCFRSCSCIKSILFVGDNVPHREEATT